MKREQMSTPEKAAEWHMVYTESGESHAYGENLGQFADRMDSLGYMCVKGWVSVKDVLPELDEEVLVVWDKGNGYPYRVTSHMTNFDRDMERTNGKHWVIQNRVHYKQEEITYWMPLPEMPKD